MALKMTSISKTETLNQRLTNVINFWENIIAERELSNDKEINDLLGSRFDGINTNTEQLLTTRSFYKKIRSAFGQTEINPTFDLGNRILELDSNQFNELCIELRGDVGEHLVDLVESSEN